MTTATQTRTLFAWHARRGLTVLTFTLIASSAIAAALAAVALWQGWPEVTEPPGGAVDGEVIIGFSSTIFGIPLGAVGIAAFVVAIGHVGAFTRALIATGATRSALTIAHLAHALLLALAASVVAAAVLALEVAFAGGWIGSTFALEPGDTFADGVPALVRGFGGALAAMLAGSLVAAVFLRWAWWVGTSILLLVTLVIPAMLPYLARVAGIPDGALTAVVTWPALPALAAVALAAVHWGVMRGLRVP